MKEAKECTHGIAASIDREWRGGRDEKRRLATNGRGRKRNETKRNEKLGRMHAGGEGASTKRVSRCAGRGKNK